MRRIFSDEQIKFITDNYKSMPYRDIANVIGLTERQVRGKINGMGLGKNRNFDKSYFSEIDAPEKAYWLGLIYADGWVIFNKAAKNYESSIELNSHDSYLLEYLAKSLGGAHEVTFHHKRRQYNGYEYETDTALLRVYSKQFAGDLIKCGVSERKTYSGIFPKPERYFRDYLRGYLDGDGCIYIEEQRDNTVFVHFTCSCKECLEYIKDRVRDEIGIDGSIYTENEHKHRLVYYRKSDVPTLLSWIYYDNNSPMLKRKYNKYLLAIGLAAS